MRRKKNAMNISTNSNISFCGSYGYSNLSLSSHRWLLGKWMSKNPNFKSNDDGNNNDNNNDNDNDGFMMIRIMTIITMMLMMRHCEGAAT